MSEDPSIVKLWKQFTDEEVYKWEEVYRLAEYNKIICFVEKIIAHIDHLQKNDSNTHNISYICKPGLHELGMTRWRSRTIDGIRQGFIICSD